MMYTLTKITWSVFLTAQVSFFFFFNDTATTEIYTLSLHDALPILGLGVDGSASNERGDLLLEVKQALLVARGRGGPAALTDRKSTRLNSSHSQISYAVFCLKKKNSDAGLYTQPARVPTGRRADALP